MRLRIVSDGHTTHVVDAATGLALAGVLAVTWQHGFDTQGNLGKAVATLVIRDVELAVDVNAPSVVTRLT